MSAETCSNPIYVDGPSPELATGLDFRPEFLSSHFERLCADGISPERAQDIIEEIAQRDLGYLFLERFTKQKLVRYSYRVENGRLFSPKYDFLGEVDEFYASGVFQREAEGKNSDRERAELEGVLGIKKELIDANEPKTFVLMSPPLPQSDYSFYFFGRFDAETGKVDMFAWRNEKPLLQQRQELNTIAGGEIISPDNHPNDFLKKPVFLAGYDFSQFRKVICDMPADGEFEATDEADFSIYSEGIGQSAEMLAQLIADGAQISTLRAAQLKIEMEMTRWVKDGFVAKIDHAPRFFPKDKHVEFENWVMRDFAMFAAVNNAQRFACGSCGSSVMSLFTSSRGVYLPGQLQLSIAELIPDYISCPGCGESVRMGSAQCKNCGLTKSEYDSKKAA